MDQKKEQAKSREASSGYHVSAGLTPDTSMHMLSQHEVEKLCDTSQGGLHEIFRNSALAVLTSGYETDDIKALPNDCYYLDGPSPIGVRPPKDSNP